MIKNREVISRVFYSIDECKIGDIYNSVSNKLHMIYQYDRTDRVLFMCGREFTNQVMRDAKPNHKMQHGAPAA